MKIRSTLTATVVILASFAVPAYAAPASSPTPQESASAAPTTTSSSPTPAVSLAPTTQAPSAASSTQPAQTPRAKTQDAAAANTPAEVVTRGAIGARYTADGGANASYGKPIAPEVCGQAHDSCYQDFERGTIVWSPTTGTKLVKGGFRAEWKAAGGPASYMGIPTTEEIPQENGHAAEQLFSSNGGFYWTDRGTGIHYVKFSGAIGKKWSGEGDFRAPGKFGFPTSDEECNSNGLCAQRFEYSTITWGAKPGTHVIKAGFRTKWEAAGGLNSPYGVPSTDEISHFNGHAAEQLFSANGAMYWTDWGTGTHYVKFSGGVGNLWARNGNFREKGTDTPTRYGFPIADEICPSGGECYQKFENGTVTWNFAQGLRGYEMQKCQALNNGRSKYSPQGADRVALAFTGRYSNYRKDPGGYQGTFFSCKKVYGSYVLDWRTAASFGENGFLSPNRRINDYETGELLPAGVTGNTAAAYSPTGSYTFSNPFGVGNPRTGFSGYHTLNPSSRWGGDRNTWYYNSYIENAALGYPNENMWSFATRGDYRQGVLINYNKSDDGKRTLSGNAGFAIMLHTVPSGSSVYQYPTWGCIAIDHDRINQFLREGHDGDRIIMGVESEVMNW